MDDNLNSISEIMKPTHLQKINPLPRDKSMVPFGFGIIPTGKFVQYNKDMIPYREYIKLLRVAIKLNTYFLQDVSDMDTVVASMEIKNLQGNIRRGCMISELLTSFTLCIVGMLILFWYMR